MNQYQKKLVNLKQSEKSSLGDFSIFLTNDENSGTMNAIRNKMFVTDDHLEKLDLSKMTELERFKYDMENENAEKKKAKGEQMHREFMLKKKWEEERNNEKNIIQRAAETAFNTIADGIELYASGVGSLGIGLYSFFNNLWLYIIGIIAIIILIKKI
ncbi:hypothetical protein ABPG74_003053 [Tetrahymena malaccensis]